MKRKTAPQIAWEKLSNKQTNSGEWMPTVTLSRRDFNRIYQLAYRRGMERAIDIVDSPFNGDAAADLRAALREGAKDE